MTFVILTEDTNNIVHCSEVCSAEDQHHSNFGTTGWGDDHNSEGIICSKSDDAEPDAEESRPMALVDPEELVAFTFEMPDEDGDPAEMTTVEAIEEHQKQVFDDTRSSESVVTRSIGRDSHLQQHH